MSNWDHLPKRSQSAERHREGPQRFQLSIYRLIHRRQTKQPGNLDSGRDGECYFSNTSADSCNLALWCSGVQPGLHPSNCTWNVEKQKSPYLRMGNRVRARTQCDCKKKKKKRPCKSRVWDLEIGNTSVV